MQKPARGGLGEKMKFAKWALKVAGLALIFCTFGWIPVMTYCALADDKNNFVIDWLVDVLAPIDRFLS